VETINKTFSYNRTFAEVPSHETDEAWESLFPPHGGFFNVTELGSQRSTLSVFHQLHCLVCTSVLKTRPLPPYFPTLNPFRVITQSYF
jgi:hypothetical protein